MLRVFTEGHDVVFFGSVGDMTAIANAANSVGTVLTYGSFGGAITAGGACPTVPTTTTPESVEACGVVRSVQAKSDFGLRATCRRSGPWRSHFVAPRGTFAATESGCAAGESCDKSQHSKGAPRSDRSHRHHRARQSRNELASRRGPPGDRNLQDKTELSWDELVGQRGRAIASADQVDVLAFENPEQPSTR